MEKLLVKLCQLSVHSPIQSSPVGGKNLLKVNLLIRFFRICDQ